MIPTGELNSEWFFLLLGKTNNSHLDKAKIHDSRAVISDGMTGQDGQGKKSWKWPGHGKVFTFPNSNNKRRRRQRKRRLELWLLRRLWNNKWNFFVGSGSGKQFLAKCRSLWFILATVVPLLEFTKTCLAVIGHFGVVLNHIITKLPMKILFLGTDFCHGSGS